MLATITTLTRRIEVFTFIGFTAALAGCTSVAEVTQDDATAKGTAMMSDGSVVSVDATNSGATSFTDDPRGGVSAELTGAAPGGEGVLVTISANVPIGNAMKVDLASLGAQVCVCSTPRDEPTACVSDTTACAPAVGTFSGTYDDTDQRDAGRTHQLVGTFDLAGAAGFTGRIRLVHHEDWTVQSSGGGGGGGSFWSTNWNG